MTRPSQNERILAVLDDGGWHNTADLYARCGGMILHSRISELRKRGFWIVSERVPGETGPRSFRYRLVPALTEREVGGGYASGGVRGRAARVGPSPLEEDRGASRSASVGGLLDEAGGRRDSAARPVEQLPPFADSPRGGCSPCSAPAGAVTPSGDTGAQRAHTRATGAGPQLVLEGIAA